MEIIYSDRDISVVIKPAGMSSQSMPDGTGAPDVIGREENCTVYPVHRLDTATAGVMVYAKNKSAAAALSRDIAGGAFEKEYVALVHGVPSPEKGEFCDLLFRDASKNKSYVVKRERRGVKKASLEYETLCARETDFGTVSAVRIRLQTGRTHQIRVQFASRKLMLVGDGKYGARDGAKNLALFCRRLSFPLPSTGERLTFEAVPPFEDFFADKNVDGQKTEL